MFFHKKIKKNTKNCFFEVKAAADKKGSFKKNGDVAKLFCNIPAWYYEQYGQPTAHAAERRKARLAAA